MSDDTMAEKAQPEKAEWLAVRCCCTPRKILGFLRATPHAESLSIMTFDGRVDFQIRDAHECMIIGGKTYRHRERAIYSEDRPIDFWRTVHGFVEAR